MPDLLQLLLASLAAGAGSAINSIAGGGTLLTFPALVAVGIPPIVANATSTVALWPGAVGSLWGYRRSLTGSRAWAIRFAVPSFLGGLAGALLLLRTPPEQFSAIVPWLVLGGTLLFMMQGPVLRLARARRARQGALLEADTIDAAPLAATPSIAAAEAAVTSAADATMTPPRLVFLFYQFLVSIYGGYFGAGIGILMLAALGLMGLTDIHRMNGLKHWGGACINLIAAVTFAFSDLVNWPVALGMAVGAVAGGYGGSRLAQRVPQERVRAAIVIIGLASAVWLMFAGI